MVVVLLSATLSLSVSYCASRIIQRWSVTAWDKNKRAVLYCSDGRYFFMGQYRLWLHHREIDQLIQAQLKTLVKELARVDEQISLLANNTLQVDNVIIQALLKEFQVEISSVPVPGVPVQAPLTSLSGENLLPID